MDKIICVGKNYLEHARELGDDVPEKPVIFLKPPSVLRQANNWNDTIQASFPKGKGEVHPECEMILQVGFDGYQLTPEQAKNAIESVSLGLDMTLRTHQAQLKKSGHPWTTAKVFLDAAIIGPWIPITEFKNYMDIEFSMSIDGIQRQYAFPSEMMMKPVDLLIYISQFFPLCAGDIIFTGTPVGVSPINEDSIVEMHWGEKKYSVKWI